MKAVLYADMPRSTKEIQFWKGSRREYRFARSVFFEFVEFWRHFDSLQLHVTRSVLLFLIVSDICFRPDGFGKTLLNL